MEAGLRAALGGCNREGGGPGGRCGQLGRSTSWRDGGGGAGGGGGGSKASGWAVTALSLGTEAWQGVDWGWIAPALHL